MTWELNGHTLEFIDEGHIYLIDGVMVPSITQMIRVRHPNQYAGIPTSVLNAAAMRGTAVHEAIQRYVETGEEADLPEMRGFQRLCAETMLRPVHTERPVILFDDSGEPFAAGRYDLCAERDGILWGIDIKRQQHPDWAYLMDQLNLYRRAAFQTYGEEWTSLACFKLRDSAAEWFTLPVDEKVPYECMSEYRKFKEEKNDE